MSNRNRCGHCRRVRWIKSRGLCFACHSTPGVRDRYEPRAVVGALSALYGTTNPPLRTPVPTMHGPGTPGKVAVLEARAAAGERLWHDADAKERGEHDREVA